MTQFSIIVFLLSLLSSSGYRLCFSLAHFASLAANHYIKRLRTLSFFFIFYICHFILLFIYCCKNPQTKRKLLKIPFMSGREFFKYKNLEQHYQCPIQVVLFSLLFPKPFGFSNRSARITYLFPWGVHRKEAALTLLPFKILETFFFKGFA